MGINSFVFAFDQRLMVGVGTRLRPDRTWICLPRSRAEADLSEHIRLQAGHL
jgi:hypothetical protein